MAQICENSKSASIQILSSVKRSSDAKDLQKLQQLVGRICSQAKQSLETQGQEAGSELSASQRSDMEDFEKTLVRCCFSSNGQLKAVAVDLAKAIFADAENFSGLKPLPQYTDAFAYELLFPSWLNLLSACMLSVDGKRRLDAKQQLAVFQFLNSISDVEPRLEHGLVGFFTFITSRFSSPQCADLLQRMIELYERDGSQLIAQLDKLDESSKDARQFKERLRDMLVVRSMLGTRSTPSKFVIAEQRPSWRPLPASLAEQFVQLELQESWEECAELAGLLRSVVESEHAIAAEYSQLLASNPTFAKDLLSLLVQKSGNQAERVLAAECQICLARMLNAEQLDPHRLQAFAQRVAHRLTGLSDEQIEFFCNRFVDNDSQRARLLKASEADAALQEIADEVFARAGKTSETKTFLNWMLCGIVIAPAAEMLDAKVNLLALQGVIDNRSIGTKELQDLLDDLQSNTREAVEHLASPIRAAGCKSERLATLYLTLNEIGQRLVEAGTVDNFSVVRAKYAMLTRGTDL